MEIKIVNAQGRNISFKNIQDTHLRVMLGDEVEIVTNNCNPSILESSGNNVVIVAFETPSTSNGTALKLELLPQELAKLRAFFSK